ncbi:PREDICTED: uncharacterized protein LOC109152737 [Ipomoea nil]|uniref:uncharacterized protein LOC109152737 n=1 Tax=Ipomoea nil TaxID=35883 RepID=UPI00090091E5|nr:PREDICTED: uncharacterized protein LOC109152737 [Ipomoea nil]
MERKEAFVVSHKEPQLLVPAKPTPHEIKELSDIDDQKSLRIHVSLIMFYRANPRMKAKEPVEAIRDALAEALVWYYPLAGRLIHGPKDKLMVDCSGEGILFVEADCNFRLEDVGDAIKPPCLYSKELLYQVPGSDGILGCPLMLVQVTRLICGGFVVAIRANHVLSDGLGLAQFVKAVEELAQGASSPSTKPIWRRELLTAKHLPPPLQTTYDHTEAYDIISHKSITDPYDNLVSRSFFFGPKEMKAIRQKLPPHYTQPHSKFDLITASVWICRTRALEFDGDETVAVICAVNVRDKGPPELRDGYYGNAVVVSAAVAKAGRLLLCDNSPLEYAVKLIEKAKSRVSEDYVRSVVKFLDSNGRPPLLRSRSSIVVTDLARLGFHQIDFGWGKPVYGGTMDGGASATAITHARYRNSDGQDDVLVPVFLPAAAMKRFEEEMNKFTALEPRQARKQAFVVNHKEPQLLVPAKPTPHEIKELSDIDDQKGLRIHISMIMFYRANPLMKARDPVETIRDALAEALVWYYPLAGRLIHGPNEDKLMVDCSGEGILFVEADSNFSLEDFGDAIRPPCLYSKELLYQVPGSDGILGYPLMLVQVTRLMCGGFVVAIRANHVLTNGLGLAQFVKAVEELAQGASSPSTKPIWRRELLTAKHLPPPLQTTYDHTEAYDIISHKSITDPYDNLVSRSFFFGPKELKAIRQKLPPPPPQTQRRPTSKFDLITACIWICRTRALEFDGDETVAVICPINVRDKGPPELRDGYYGNAVVVSAAVAKAGKLLLCDNSPLEYAVELIEKAKSRVSGDYIRSEVNFLDSNGKPPLLRTRNSIVVTDLTRLGFHRIDFGWGKPVYGGTMDGGASATAITHARYRNSDGQDGVLVPVFLPAVAMKRFEEEMNKFTALEPPEILNIPSKSFRKSAL